MTTRSMLPLLLLLSAVLPGCVSTAPSAADVAADRAMWQAMKDVTADGSIDAQEAPVLAQTFAQWDSRLRADEARVARADTTWQDLVRVYGLATLGVFGVNLEAQAPQLYRYVDRNGNHTIEVAELEALSVDDLRNPVFAAALVSTAVQLIAKERHGGN